jgi:hypothetical protein
MRKFVPYFNTYMSIFYLKIFEHLKAIFDWLKFESI